ncbi:hypothetical protein MCOR25_009737 [Pyricularia grisea]|nr:hypothetical protein MCOR25_009737 [Pyricularia grisea]
MAPPDIGVPPVTHLYFLGLSAVGYDWLWGRINRGPGIKAIVDTRRTGVFPTGSRLMQSYTGWLALDTLFVPAVIFYNDLLSSTCPAHRLLLIDIFSTMQTTTHCMTVLGWDCGESGLWAVIENIFWGVFNQAWGAATVYPIYCFAHAARWLQVPDKNDRNRLLIGPKTAQEALPLPAIAIIGSLTPVMLLYPTFATSCSTKQRQTLIALYRLTPPVLALLRPAASAALGLRRNPKQTDEDRRRAQRLTAASLAASGTAATLAHWCAMATAFLNPKTSLTRVFSPFALGDRDKSGLGETILAEVAHEFLQWDVVAVGLALAPLSYIVWMTRSRGVVVGKEASSSLSPWRKVLAWGPTRVLMWGFACVALSPGGLLAWTLVAQVMEGLKQDEEVPGQQAKSDSSNRR